MRDTRMAMTLQKAGMIERMKKIVADTEGILFACIFGSFVERDHYRDVDVAVYLDDHSRTDTLALEFSLEEKLEKALSFPCDVRVINQAPLGFLYSVLSQKILLIDRDSTRRACFESLVYRMYFDYQHLLRDYLAEVGNAPV